MTTRTDNVVFAQANAFHAECAVVEAFLNDTIRPIATRRQNGTAEHATYLGVLLRVSAWLRSVAKLNEPGDFQAATAGSRALFEVSIDLTLLVHASASHPHELILGWEQSAKLYAAEKVAERHSAGSPIPAEEQTIVDFARNERATIVAERARLWPNRPKKDRHPQRWTGRSLGQDAAEADRVASHDFAEFYATRYPALCWNTHGSGFAGIRTVGAEIFPGLGAVAMGECARFGAVCAEELFHAFGAHDAIAEARLEALQRERTGTKIRALAMYPNAAAEILGLRREGDRG